MKRSRLKIAAYVIGGFFLILVVLYSLAVTSPGEDIIKSRLEKYLSGITGGTVTIDKFETNLFSRVRIDRLTASSGQNGSCDTFLYLSRLEGRYSLLNLIFGDRTLHSIVLDTIDLCLVRDSLGLSGLPAAEESAPRSPDTTTGELSVNVGRLSLACLNIRYTDSVYTFSTRLNGGAVAVRRGDSGLYRFNLGFDDIDVTYDSLPIYVDNVHAAGTWRPALFSIDSLIAGVQGLSLDLRGSIAGQDFDEISASIKMTGSPAALLDTLRANDSRFDVAIASNILAEIQVTGSMNAPSVNLRSQISDLRYREIDIDRAVLEAHYSSDTLYVNSLEVQGFGGNIGGHGYTVIDSTLASRHSLNFSELRIDNIWSAVYGERPLYRGFLQGKMEIDGSGMEITGWKTNVVMSAEKLQYNDKPVPDLVLTINSDGRNMSFDLAEGLNTAKANLTLNDKNIAGSFDLNIPKIAPLAGLANQSDLTGAVAASGKIGGSLDNPRIGCHFNGSRLTYQSFPVDTVWGSLTYSDRTVEIDTLFVSGRWDSKSGTKNPFDLDSLEGTIAYQAELAGSMDALGGRFNARLEEPSYYQYMVDSVLIDGSLNGMSIVIDRMDFFHRGVDIRAEGKFDAGKKLGSIKAALYATPPAGDSASGKKIDERDWIYRGQLTSDFAITPDSQLTVNLITDSLHAGPLLGWFSDTLPADGVIDMTLEFHGTATRPQAKVKAIVREIILPESKIDSLGLVCRLDDNVLRISSFKIHALNQKADAAGELILGRDTTGMPALTESSRLNGTVEVDSFDLAVLGDFLPIGDLAGRLSSKVQIEGTFAMPEIRGEVEIRDGRFQTSPESMPIEAIQVQTDIEDTALKIVSASAVMAGQPVTLTGRMTLKELKTIDMDFAVAVSSMAALTVKGKAGNDALDLQVMMHEFRLGIIQPLMPQIDSLSGMIDCELNISGKPIAPELDGYLNLKDMSIRSEAYYLKASRGNGRITFGLHRVTIDTLYADVNGGFAAISGSLNHNLASVTDIDLRAVGDSIKIEEAGVFAARVDSVQLHYSKPNEYFLLDGDIHLGESKFTAGLRLQNILPWARSMETVDYDFPEMVQKTKMNIRLHGGQQLWVDNNLAKIRLHSELGVIGTPIQPNLTGMVKIEEGYLLYLDRRFEITQGQLYFTDPIRINPDVQLDASTVVTTYRRMETLKYTISIKLSGLLDQLQVALNSDPPLDKSDIVALLTLGATRSELTAGADQTGEGGAKNLLLDRAAMLSSQRVSGYVSNEVSSLFGFQEFTIQGNLFQFDRSWGPQLVASKKLTGRLAVTYSTTVGRLNDQTIRLNYRLTPHFSLQGQTDRQGRSLVDFKYGIKFR